MADEKKISGLTEASDASASDEFVVVNKDVTSGADASASGQTSKITLDNLRNAILGGSGGSTGNGVVFTEMTRIQPSASKPGFVFGSFNTETPDGTYLKFGWAGEDNLSGQTGSKMTLQSIERFGTNQGGYRDLLLNEHGGNVGIGTASPGQKLEVVGDVKAENFDSLVTTGYNAGFSKPSTHSPAIKFQGINSGIGLNWALGIDHVDGNSNKFYFQTIGDADDFKTQPLTIQSDGNVGIGTDSPTSRLDVLSTGAGDGIKLTPSTSNAYAMVHEGSSGNVGFQLRSSGADGSSAPSLSFSSDANDNYILDGNVGIGTDSPTNKLDVFGDIFVKNTGDIGTYATLKLGQSDLRTSYIRAKRNDSGNSHTLEFGTNAGSAEAETQMVINNLGNVGIGNDLGDMHPNYGLSIHNRGGMLVRNTQGSLHSQTGLIRGSISDRYDQDDWGVGINQVCESASNGFGLAFWTRDAYNGTYTEKVRIDKDGLVGIGTDEPNAKLSVGTSETPDNSTYTSAIFQYGIEVTSPSDSYLALKSQELIDGKTWVIANNTSTVNGVKKAGYLSIGHTNHVLCLTQDNKVGIGTYEPGHRLNVSDGTVNFKINPMTDQALGTEAQIGTVTNHALKIQTNNVTRMTFDTNDNVGIATATPHTNLEVRDSTSNCIVSITSGSNAYYSQIAFCHDVDDSGAITERASIRGKYASNGGGQLDFYTDNTAGTQVHRMTIGNNGVVHVVGNLTTSGTASSVGFDADNLDNVRATEASGLDSINNLVVSDFEKDGVTKVGIVAQDMQKVLPQSVSGGDEYEAVAVEAEGDVVRGLGTEDEHIYSTDIKKSDFENPEHTWDEGAEFIETKAEETETRNHSLATANDELIATLVKAVQELSAELNELKSK